ncbi:arsenate reductase ArsC [Candidatus Latescibacterota bacterium]
MLPKTNVLFLCTGNSCRSQMAEGWTRHLWGDRFDAYSAGTDPRDLDPRAVKAMAEVGVDISTHRAKDVSELMDISFDEVITLCDHAAENCPFFPGDARIRHVGFKDPPKLAEQAISEEEAMSHYRLVRDDIRAFVETLPDFIGKQEQHLGEFQ